MSVVHINYHVHAYGCDIQLGACQPIAMRHAEQAQPQAQDVFLPNSRIQVSKI